MRNRSYKVKQYHEGYGYDLEKVLSKLPIRELGDAEQKATLIKSLQKGNVPEVTFEKEGVQEKRLMEASPQFKSVNVYSEEGKKLFLDNTLRESSSLKSQSTRQTNNHPDGKDTSKRKGLSM